jgi:hypothetical protein
VGSAFVGINDTITVRRALYADKYPIILNDACWILAKDDAVHCSIVPIDVIQLFISKTSGSARFAGTSPARTVSETDTLEGNRSWHDPSMARSALDLNSRPTETAPVLDMMVEDQCKSTWVSKVLEKQRCHFVHYTGSTSGSAPEVESGKDESILDALNPESDVYSPMNSEEYAVGMKEYDEELSEVDQPPAIQQILVTMTELAGYDTANQNDPKPELEAPSEDMVWLKPDGAIQIRHYPRFHHNKIVSSWNFKNSTGSQR